MKKQYYLVMLILVIGVCLSTHNSNCLKACDKNAAACLLIKKKEIKNMPPGFAAEAELPFDMFMNPLIN